MNFWKIFSLPMLLSILIVFTICVLDGFWVYEDAEKYISFILMASAGFTAIFIRDVLFVFTVFFYYKLAVKIIVEKFFPLHTLGHNPLLKDVLIIIDVLMFLCIIFIAILLHELLSQYYNSFTAVAYTIAVIRDAVVVFLAFVGFTFLQEQTEPVFIARKPQGNYFLAFSSLITLDVWNLKNTEEWKDSFFAKYVPILYATPILIAFVVIYKACYNTLEQLSMLGSIHSGAFLSFLYNFVINILFFLREISFVIIGWIAIAILGIFFYCLLNSIPRKRILYIFLSKVAKLLLSLLMIAAGIYLFFQNEELLFLHDKGVEEGVSMVFHLTTDCMAIYCVLVFSCILVEFMIRKMNLEKNLIYMTS